MGWGWQRQLLRRREASQERGRGEFRGCRSDARNLGSAAGGVQIIGQLDELVAFDFSLQLTPRGRLAGSVSVLPRLRRWIGF